MSELDPPEGATECPGCESMQKFSIRFRDHDVLPGVKIAYLKCHICPWEHEIGPTTDEIEKTRGEVARLAAQIKGYEDRTQAEAPVTWYDKLDTLRQKRNKLVVKLQERVSGLDTAAA